MELGPETEALLLERVVLNAEEARHKAHRVPDVLLEGGLNCMETQTVKSRQFQAQIERPCRIPDGSIAYRYEEKLATRLSPSLEDSRIGGIRDDAVRKAWLYRNIVHCDSGSHLFAAEPEMLVEPGFEESEGPF